MTDDWLRWSWGCGGADPRPQRRVGGEGIQADDVADGGLGYAPAEQDVAAIGWDQRLSRSAAEASCRPSTFTRRR